MQQRRLLSARTIKYPTMPEAHTGGKLPFPPRRKYKALAITRVSHSWRREGTDIRHPKIDIDCTNLHAQESPLVCTRARCTYLVFPNESLDTIEKLAAAPTGFSLRPVWPATSTSELLAASRLPWTTVSVGSSSRQSGYEADVVGGVLYSSQYCTLTPSMRVWTQ